MGKSKGHPMKLLSQNDRYFITESGEITNRDTYARIKPRINKDGYEIVTLTDYDGDKTNYRVHVLVATNFIDNPMNKSQVNHIDGNKLNNTVSNLEWCTPRENTLHALREGLRPGFISEELFLIILDEIKTNTIRSVALKYGINEKSLANKIRKYKK